LASLLNCQIFTRAFWTGRMISSCIFAKIQEGREPTARKLNLVFIASSYLQKGKFQNSVINFLTDFPKIPLSRSLIVQFLDNLVHSILRLPDLELEICYFGFLRKMEEIIDLRHNLFIFERSNFSRDSQADIPFGQFRWSETNGVHSVRCRRVNEL
jgi:hypothetical protein